LSLARQLQKKCHITATAEAGMEQVTTAQGVTQAARTHPVLIAAGVAVLLFSTLGAAALMGWIPSATSTSGERAPAAQAPAAQVPAVTPQKKNLIPARTPAGVLCATCGVVEAMNAIEVKGKTSGVGAVAGGVAGGLLGSQFGNGGTQAVLTVGGAAGGAFAGDAIEGHVKKRTEWRVTVRMGDGSARVISQNAQPPYAVGDRVRVVNGSTLERA
jgi:outer membrane lipoprotein SlyB